MRNLLLSSLLLISITSIAGGWLQGKGNAFYKVNQSIIKGNQLYDGDGKIIDIVTIGVYQTSFYTEIGLSQKFDGIAYLPFFSRVTLNKARFSNGTFNPGDEVNSVGDAQLGVKYGIKTSSKLVIATSFILGLPFGNPEGGETSALQTGDGEFNQMVMVDFGYGFKNNFYANVGAGLNNRTKGFSEEWRITAEAGKTIENKLNVAVKFFSVQSFMNGDPKGSNGGGIFSNNIEFISFGPEFSYLFSPKFGLSFAYFGASSGRFILAEPSYNFGLFLKMQ